VEVLERRCLLSHSPAVTFSFVVPAGTPNEVIGPGTVLALVPAESRKEAQLFRFLGQHPKDHLDATMLWQEGGTVQVARVTLRALKSPAGLSLKSGDVNINLSLKSGDVNINPAPTAGFGGTVTQVRIGFRPEWTDLRLDRFDGPRQLFGAFGQQFGQAFASWMQTLGQFFNIGAINIGAINIGDINAIGGGIQVGGIDIGGIDIGGINIGGININGIAGIGGIDIGGINIGGINGIGGIGGFSG
jgi:hypothetical protein